MRRGILPSLCTIGILFGATTAMAGAYGEDVDAVESPAPAPAAAVVEETTVDYATTGPYIGLGGLYAVELFDDNSVGGARTDNSGGFHVKAGYRLHPRAAAEVRYEHYNEFDLDLGHIDGWSIWANMKGYILTGRCQPFAQVGLGYIEGAGSGGNFAGAAHPGKDFAMRFGGGIDTYITEHISIGPDFAYVLPTGNARDLDMFTVSLGLTYKF